LSHRPYQKSARHRASCIEATTLGLDIRFVEAKQPYAIAMKDGSPFGIGGLWENWHDPTSSEWIRTFAIITTDANELVAEIHDRMPLILAPVDYTRWLSDEPDPGDLMRPFPAEPRASTSRRSLDRRADRVSYFGGIITPP